MKKLYSIGIAIVFAQLLNAQINVGAIAFLGFQADAPDAFAFVTLQDFNTGDSLFFTDAGWNGSQFFANEGTMSWKADQSIPAGSVVRIQDPNNASIPNALIEGPGLTRGKMSSLTLSGDQLFAYIINSNGNQIPLAAFSTNAFISQCDASGLGNTPRSCLPSNLTLGQNAIQLNDNAPAAANPNNAFFNQLSTSGTPDEIASIVNNPLNWIADEEQTLAGYNLWPAWQFNVGSIGNVEIGFLNNSVELTEGGNPQEIQLSVNPPLNLPKFIVLQINLNNGIESGDIISNPSNINGVIQLEIPANQNLVNFTLAASADDGIEGNENGLLRIVSVDEGLSLTTDSVLSFSIIEDIQNSFVSFSGIESNISIVEGEELNFLLTFNPITSSDASLNIVFQSDNGFTESDYSTTPSAFSNSILIEIPAGTSTFPLSFLSLDDSEVEPSENMQISITGLSSNLLPGVNTQLALSIADNDVPVSYQNLNINEIMVNNTVTISDEFSEYDDWIEIRNSGTFSISLTNLYITNDPLLPNKFQFSSSPLCSVAPNSYKLVWADDSTEQGPLHLNFKLNNSGGFVGLYALQSGEFGPFYSLIDSISYPAMNVDLSYALLPESEDIWVLSSNATPGLENQYLVGLERESIDAFALFPNPAIETVHLIKNDISDIVEVTVYNSSGRTVSCPNREIENEIVIQTSDLPKGIYFIHIKTNKSLYTKKLIVAE
jgi:hypothetical protein